MLSQGYVSSLLSPFLPRLTSPQRNPFDIGHTTPDPFPPPYALGYLNNAWVRQALNVPVNFTDKTSVVLNSTSPLPLPPQSTLTPHRLHSLRRLPPLLRARPAIPPQLRRQSRPPPRRPRLPRQLVRRRTPLPRPIPHLIPRLPPSRLRPPAPPLLPHHHRRPNPTTRQPLLHPDLPSRPRGRVLPAGSGVHRVRADAQGQGRRDGDGGCRERVFECWAGEC